MIEQQLSQSQYLGRSVPGIAVYKSQRLKASSDLENILNFHKLYLPVCVVLGVFVAPTFHTVSYLLCAFWRDYEQQCALF